MCSKEKLAEKYIKPLVLCGGTVVSVLTFYSNDPSFKQHVVYSLEMKIGKPIESTTIDI